MSDAKKDQEETAPEFSVRDRRRVHLEDTQSSDTEPESGSRQEPADESEPHSDPATGGQEPGPSAADIESARDLADAAAKQHRQAPEVDFTTFVISLASSAIVHLGMAPHPEGGEPEINLPMAKQVVDMLAMLKEKTRGNLDEEEDRYLEAILYDLRLRFVEATRAHGKKKA